MMLVAYTTCGDWSDVLCSRYCCFFVKQKTAYEMRISDWSSDVCSSDLDIEEPAAALRGHDHIGAVGTVLEAGRDQPCGNGNALAHRFLAMIGAEIGRASCRERECQHV